MSKFKPGDRVRHMRDHSDTATILAIHDGRYWAKCDAMHEPTTLYVTHVDRLYELIPEPFLPDGDSYCIVYANGVVSDAYSSLTAAESIYERAIASAPRLGIIRIDGQTGELSWAHGGPKAVKA